MLASNSVEIVMKDNLDKGKSVMSEASSFDSSLIDAVNMSSEGRFY